VTPLRRTSLLAAALFAAAVCGACGKKGPARPPEPRGPFPAKAVTARQIGGRAVVTFTAPKARGDKPAQQPARAELVRVDYAPGGKPPADPDAFRRRGVVVATLEGDPVVPDRRVTMEDPTVGQLTDHGLGAILRYAVRVRDRRARTSPLVIAPDLVLVESRPAPSGLKAEATGDGVRLSWDAAAGEAPKYALYRAQGDAPFPEKALPVEPLTTTEYLDASVVTGTSYRYAVRLVLADGPPPRESESSIETAVVAEDRFAPQSPTGLVAVQEGRSVRLFWNPSLERDLGGYRLYRRAGTSEWTRLGSDPIAEPLYLDEAVKAGDDLAYRVSAIDRSTPPNESAPSSEVSVGVVEDPGAGRTP
jgi:hypothetical protein